ncbi:MAG: hypothetical protein JW779_07715 [Candidatus Thorarchaeota archaeon]|nr:hypothetical protein [Candidatus Thorarchaeota archaeon]
MSDDTPERNEMVRSTVITIIFTVAFLILGLTFWAWSSPDIIETSPIGILNSMNLYVTVLLESLTMLGFFIFLSVTVFNLRLYVTQIRSGWFDLLAIFILVVAMAWIMFGTAVGAVTAILSLGFTVYLYLLQE